MARRRWALVLAAATGLALVSLITDITTISQLAGEADTFLAARSTLSSLVNAGTVWAGLGVCSGWIVRRPVQAWAAGVVAGLLALAVHYGLGRVLGMFDPDVWVENWYWFVAALVLGAPLGLAGAIARRRGMWGLAARLLVPVAAVVEPFVLGAFSVPAIIPWPDRVSSIASGSILLTAGVVGGAAVLVAARRRRSPRSGAPGRAASHTPPG